MFLALVFLYAAITAIFLMIALITYTVVAYHVAERRFQKNLAVFRSEQQLEVVSMYGMTDEEWEMYVLTAPGMQYFR